jgi:hypothetical protein
MYGVAKKIPLRKVDKQLAGDPEEITGGILISNKNNRSRNFISH